MDEKGIKRDRKEKKKKKGNAHGTKKHITEHTDKRNRKDKDK